MQIASAVGEGARCRFVNIYKKKPERVKNGRFNQILTPGDVENGIVNSQLLRFGMDHKVSGTVSFAVMQLDRVEPAILQSQQTMVSFTGFG